MVVDRLLGKTKQYYVPMFIVHIQWFADNVYSFVLNNKFCLSSQAGNNSKCQMPWYLNYLSLQDKRQSIELLEKSCLQRYLEKLQRAVKGAVYHILLFLILELKLKAEASHIFEDTFNQIQLSHMQKPVIGGVVAGWLALKNLRNSFKDKPVPSFGQSG